MKLLPSYLLPFNLGPVCRPGLQPVHLGYDKACVFPQRIGVLVAFDLLSGP